MAGTTDDTDSKDPNKDPKKKSEKKPEEDVIGQVLANELLAKLAKKHGSSIFKKASEYGVEQLPRIPTGIFLLDYALGGGFPVGRVNLVYGHKSSSKTTTVLKAVGNAQKMCANCYSFPDEAGKCKCKKFRECVAAYIDVEGTWDAKWAALHGVDLSRLIISVPEYAEQSLDIAEGLVLSGKVDVIVLDSIAFLTPAKEIEE
jgi:recombination protein RecA